jgi:GrpB-like predicted nucleotidyltransferase (UPF0157 family)
MPEPIVVVDYDPHWPDLFRELRAPVVAALGELAVEVLHVGSTSVPGLSAKPIIDMDVVVADIRDVPVAIARLATLGYVHRGDLGIAGREAFISPPSTPGHHLYVCPLGGEALRRHRAFRDYLEAHPEEARAYGALKKAAALRFRHDRAGYVEAKSAFVEEVLRRAATPEL